MLNLGRHLVAISSIRYFLLQDTVVGSLGQRITTQLLGLRGLHKQLSEVANYLKQVVDGTLPVNHTIVYHLQVRNFVFCIIHVSCIESLVANAKSSFNTGDIVQGDQV